jgi:hypothetical protein
VVSAMAGTPTNLSTTVTRSFYQEIMGEKVVEDPRVTLTTKVTQLETQLLEPQSNIKHYIKEKIKKFGVGTENAKNLDKLESEVRKFERQSLEDLLLKVREYYKNTNGGSNLKVLTFKKVKFIITCLERYMSYKGRLETADQEILTKVKGLLEQIRSEAPS